MKAANEILIIKMGGSLITEKNKAYIANLSIINHIAGVIKEIYRLGRYQLYLGQGSFAHIPAHKYRTIEGLIGKESVYGACVVKEMALKPHMICLEVLLRYKIPVFSFMGGSFLYSKAGETEESLLYPLFYAAKIGLIPIFYGDPIIDIKQGFTIYSTEKFIKQLVIELLEKSTLPITVLHLGITNGVLDTQGNTIPLITSENFVKVKNALRGSESIDVTGGMIHKVEESLQLAKMGVKVVIANGKKFNEEMVYSFEKNPDLTIIR
jgi:isopentenyl phosphate kinase